jgi:predicted secreted acid phosphatase
MKNIVIFDLDDTLTDTSHRSHLLDCKPAKWDEFYQASKDDSPRLEAIELFNYYLATGHIVLIFTGRSETTENETLEWLYKYTELTEETENFEMFMRPEGSFQKDTDMKREWYEAMGDAKDMVKIVFEDRTCVVDMWREQGLTCYQVAQNDF